MSRAQATRINFKSRKKNRRVKSTEHVDAKRLALKKMASGWNEINRDAVFGDADACVYFVSVISAVIFDAARAVVGSGNSRVTSVQDSRA